MLLKKEQVDKLLILHSGYKSVEEIADIMGLPMMFIESELKRRGYRPIYAKDKQTAQYELFTEYEKKGYDDMAKKKCLTPEQKAEIIKLREEGVRVSEIAERFDVIENTIYTVLKKYKEHEEQIADEIHDKDVNDAADDGYTCYEVTGDTDIDAYMSDRKVEEPDTVAPVTDSEQEDVCENIPDDIIPETAENVKTDDVLPCAVVDVLADMIDMLYDKITECDREMQRIKDARENAENDLNELKAFLRKNGYVEIVKMLASNAKWRALNESPNSM